MGKNFFPKKKIEFIFAFNYTFRIKSKKKWVIGTLNVSGTSFPGNYSDLFS